MDDIDELRSDQQEFLAERDWEQFHTPKSIAMAISVESAELMEIFQWHDNLPVDAYEGDETIEAAVEEELADILIYCLSMASEFDISLEDAVTEKLEENRSRFDKDTAADIRDRLEDWQKE